MKCIQIQRHKFMWSADFKLHISGQSGILVNHVKLPACHCLQKEDPVRDLYWYCPIQLKMCLLIHFYTLQPDTNFSLQRSSILAFKRTKLAGSWHSYREWWTSFKCSTTFYQICIKVNVNVFMDMFKSCLLSLGAPLKLYWCSQIVILKLCLLFFEEDLQMFFCGSPKVLTQADLV